MWKALAATGSSRQLHPGDLVVFRKVKVGSCPGPRAQDTYAEPHGESYHYTVDKYWVVSEVLPDGICVLRTRRGKVHRVAADSPALRPATLWERIFRRSRFASLRPDGQSLHDETEPRPEHPL